jgi:hypothetical protein
MTQFGDEGLAQSGGNGMSDDDSIDLSLSRKRWPFFGVLGRDDGKARHRQDIVPGQQQANITASLIDRTRYI